MTNRDRVDAFFANYVRLVLGDVEREIQSAAPRNPAANFLCALGLLAYTEVLGGIKRGSMKLNESRVNFDAFYADLGAEYRLVDRRLRAAYGDGVYKLLRCGLVHEGFFKEPGQTVAMKSNGAPCGIMEDTATGKFTFVVEGYYEDFAVAAEGLRKKKLGMQRPRFPKELRDRV